MKRSLENYRVDVPEGVSGSWKVERFVVGENAAKFSSLRDVVKGTRRAVRAGTYTRLKRGAMIMMSDTPAEVADHMKFINSARGEVLIGGLGLGMVAQACLRSHADTRVTVIEKDLDILKLVGPHYQDRFGDRIEIVEADVFTWKPPKGQRWDYAWWDIWPTICADNLPEMHKLHRRFGRRIDGEQMSWCRYACEQARNEARRWRSRPFYVAGR